MWTKSAISEDTRPQDRPAIRRPDTEGRIFEVVSRMPFVSREEFAVLGDISDGEVRHGLNRLMQKGLIDRVGHVRRKAVRTQRWYLARAGIADLAGRKQMEVSDLLEVLPLSAEWRRLLLQRLDTAEVYYRLASLATEVTGQRCRWHWRRRGWLDGTLEVGPSRYVRVCRIGDAISRSVMLSRMGSMVEMWLDGLVDTALFIAPSYTQIRLMEQWLRTNGSGIYAWLVSERELFEADPQDAIWHRPADYRMQVHPISRMLDNVGVREDAANENYIRLEKRARRSLPGRELIPKGRQADLLPAELTKGQKDLLDLIVDWPLMGSSDLMRMLGVSRYGLSRSARALIERGLAFSFRIPATGERSRDIGRRMSLSEAGLRLLSWRDRTKLDGLRTRWVVELDEEGDSEFGIRGYRLDGGRVKELARQLRHADGVHGFVSLLAEACRESHNVELEEVLPPHRSERWFEIEGQPHGLRPDASGAIRTGRGLLPFLLEYEERATRPATTDSRLDPYRRYFDVVTRVEDWGRYPVVLVVFNETEAASRFASHCARNITAPRTFTGARLPLYVSSMVDLTRTGVLGEIWLQPADLSLGRTVFWE